MDGPVCKRPGESVVDEPVLIEEREPVEARAHDRDVEVVAPSRSVDDLDAVGVGECALEQ